MFAVTRYFAGAAQNGTMVVFYGLTGWKALVILACKLADSP